MKWSEQLVWVCLGSTCFKLLRIPKDNPGALDYNLHCDTLQDVKETIYGFNGSESDLNYVDLLIFLEYNQEIVKPEE